MRGRKQTNKQNHFVINKWIGSYTDQNEEFASEKSTVMGAEEVRGLQSSLPKIGWFVKKQITNWVQLEAEIREHDLPCSPILKKDRILYQSTSDQ